MDYFKVKKLFCGQMSPNSSRARCNPQDPGGVVGSTARGWRLVGLGICKVGVVGSGSNHAPWIFWAAARRSCPNLTFLLDIMDAVSSGLKRRETFQRVISAQFKSQHL